MLSHQHGDVLLYKSELPGDVKRVPRSNRGIVLAEGEATGHAHVITDDGCTLFSAHDGRLFLAAKKPVELKHEEHRSQTITPGVYEVKRVREIDPFTEEIREVRD